MNIVRPVQCRACKSEQLEMIKEEERIISSRYDEVDKVMVNIISVNEVWKCENCEEECTVTGTSGVRISPSKGIRCFMVGGGSVNK